jgi:hypothetical protein
VRKSNIIWAGSAVGIAVDATVSAWYNPITI